MASKSIKFTEVRPISELYKPTPAPFCLPEWYKDLPSYFSADGKKTTTGQGTTSGTLKKCIPVFDGLTSGYILPVWVDVFVTQPEEGSFYEWPHNSEGPAITFHEGVQLPTYPKKTRNNQYPKFMNPWSIQTPPGYSVLIVPPLGYPDNPFTCLPAVVDSDNYQSPINFPFVLNDPNFVGLISAGTPMVQVIPFKRDEWSMEYEVSHQSASTHPDFLKLRTKMFDGYKSIFWSKKEYK
jgi:hypothetical protein